MPFDGIDVQGATEALNQAGGVDHLMNQEAAAARGTPETPTPTPQESATEQTRQFARDEQGRFASQQQEQTTEQEDTFSAVDPLTLSPELQVIYKNLQADYTRKTQQIAEQRRQYEQYGQPEEIEQAVQLYQSLQDPQYWPALYEELRTNLEQMGYTPAEAAAAANQEVQQQANQQQASPIDFSNIQDPELQPFAEAYKSLQDEVETMKAELRAEREQERIAQQQQALIGELQRQENLIRQGNPHYTDEDVGAVYELASYHNGNLLEAQQRYEDIIASRLERFLAQKSAVAQQGAAPLPGGGVQTQEPAVFGNLDDAHDAAMEYLRQVDAFGD